MDLSTVTENRRKGRGEGRSGLDCRVGILAYIMGSSESKGALGLICSDTLLNPDDIGVHGTHIVQIREQKGLARIESNRQDIFGILISQPMGVLQTQIFPEEFFIIGHLNH